MPPVLPPRQSFNRCGFDADRVTSRRFRLTDFPATIAAVLKTNDLRTLSGACFAFNGVQSVFIAYFVTYLVSLGYELTTAGFIFSLIVFLAMPCRVLWGMARQFSRFAARRDGWSVYRDGSQHRDAWTFK